MYQISVDESIGLKVHHCRADLSSHVQYYLCLLYHILALTQVLQKAAWRGEGRGGEGRGGGKGRGRMGRGK